MYLLCTDDASLLLLLEVPVVIRVTMTTLCLQYLCSYDCNVYIDQMLRKIVSDNQCLLHINMCMCVYGLMV